MTRVRDIVSKIEQFAPLETQESYDNSGLQIGSYDDEVKGVLIAIDITEDVIAEADLKGCNLIISHHPLIFGGIKKICGRSYVERCIISAIRKGICIYAAHTNLDKSAKGVSYILAKKLGLSEIKPLAAEYIKTYKIVTYCPKDYTEAIAQAAYSCGAGCIGNYDKCSFRSNGTGSFRAGAFCNPFAGEIGEYHFENEDRLELIATELNKKEVISKIKETHPYEEPAIDVFETETDAQPFGLGCIGVLNTPTQPMTFLNELKKLLNIGCLRYTSLPSNDIKKVALCGGAGHEFLQLAKSKGADIFLTADIKYHQFFDAKDNVCIVDIGHYESEQFTKELIFDIICEKNANFAILYSETNTNPIKYL